jgi:DNA-binding response OmpR family regulator
LTGDLAAAVDRSAEHYHASVLLVEDEVMILAIVQEALEEASFQVFIAESRDEALQLLEKQPVDILVTDVRLQRGADGWEIARRARALSPGIPVVYVTACDSGDFVAEGVEGSRLIRKPFEPHVIVETVSDLLDRGPERAA